MSNASFPSLRLVVMAKAPLPGYAKTRLIPALGEQGAAFLAEKLLQQTLQEAVMAELGPVELHVAPDCEHPFWRTFALPDGVTLHNQSQGSLGQRLWEAANTHHVAGQGLFLLGTDCPALTASRLREAATALMSADAVMHPANDGGYTLLGLKRLHFRLFEDICWSTEVVARQTLERLQECDMSCRRLEILHDIDEPEDLQFLPRDWALSQEEN
ncbi:TIGR04282 family arsenosugar biosynthesis glycosyltransferase [Microbulbifer sp. THAF38]|uniref:TIGR04282 family arsenosugar biosynthesis glycosyltransferase n=1 Tax=Microbulbifer sp. THAF38 TaxID=2587856 RepID=UPI0012679FE9|nr:TIGR04282 family arsenosugar biosynthesis glycosyltransferase [Microbulbifer sp. THAF38]QFT55898.1 2-phospho-L-lactate guanylyltransferase [Microbulbifer sp. THAF38]